MYKRQTFLSLGAAGQELRGGGLLSALIGWPLLALCGRPAANVIIVVVVVMFFMLLTSTTPVDLSLIHISVTMSG